MKIGGLYKTVYPLYCDTCGEEIPAKTIVLFLEDKKAFRTGAYIRVLYKERVCDLLHFTGAEHWFKPIT